MAATKRKTPTQTTVDPEEIAKFSAMAEEWWDEQGKFKPLHKFNPTRIAYIREQIAAILGPSPDAERPLKGLKLLDIGCGGGLLAEPMARLGAEVTAIDASEKNIQIASLHAEQSKLAIDYQCTTAEALAESGAEFDVVLNMEVIEHVADVPAFMAACSALVKPGGLMFIATLNRTLKSFAFGIVGAEYVLRWLPRGTHDWQKFLTPAEVEAELEQHQLQLKDLHGVTYSLFQDRWALSRDVSVNYLLTAQKALTKN